MKVIILSAGLGKRLLPLTHTTPKPLLKVGKYRLIEYLIKSLVAAGFNDIIINIAHLKDKFPVALGDGKKYQATLTYSAEPTGGLETAGGIINALPLLGNKPFLVVNGDIWTDYPFIQLSGYQLAHNQLAHLVLVSNPAHHPQGDFALKAGGIVTTQSDQKCTYSGIGVYHPDLFAGMAVTKKPLKPILLQAIAKNQISGEHYRGTWSDIGTIDRLKNLNQQLTASLK